MKRNKRSSRGHHPAWVRTCFTALGLSAAASAVAQPVFVSPPSPPAPRTSASSSDSAEDGEGGLLAGIGESFSPGLPFAWRKLVFRPSVSYGFTYGNGLRASSQRLVSTNLVVNGTNIFASLSTNRAPSSETIVQTISPGMSVDIGDQWDFNYTPSITLYSNSDFEDTVNHSARLSGGTTYEDWTFGLNLNTALASRPETETGAQTKQQSYGANLKVERQLNRDFSFDLSAGINFRFAESFTSRRNYTTMNWLNQQLTPNFGVGVGVGAGLEDVGTGVDMVYLKNLGRINWQFTQKLDLSLNGGVETREFLDSDRPTSMSPTYGISLSYNPFILTTVTLNGSRSVSASFFQNQVNETTTLRLGLHQRFLKHFNAGLSVSYGVSTYESSTGANVTTTREDSHTSFTASLGTSFLKRASASVFYSISDNVSDRTGFDYSSTQIGFQMSFGY
ncbi:MAG: outer membrane beta-barrel protein [Akkermansiaceae bacterium]|nr:outer membrane beta-barrel protein [Verrucomicrobiales bacterium]